MMISAASLSLTLSAVTTPARGDEYVVIVPISPVGGSDLRLHGINASGQAVGQITISSQTKACLWLPEDAYGLDAGINILDDNFVDFEGSIAFDINDIGVIVGHAVNNSQGEFDSSLAVVDDLHFGPPIPTPATLSPLGIVLFVWRRRRR